MVEVKWNDATGESGWMDINKAKLSKPARPVSLGYLLDKTKERIIIFTDYIVDDEDGTLTVGNVTTIFVIGFKMSRRFILRTNMAITIEVRNNNVEKALRVLKKKLNKDGQMKELKQRQYYQRHLK